MKRIRKMTMIMGMLTFVSAGMIGCSGQDGSTTSKQDIIDLAKADNEKDYCEIYGWYGDGECDTFCQKPDPDCENGPPIHLTDAQASGILDLVNDCDVSLQDLDIKAKLDSRAAENIISHRDGSDQTCGTGDDDPFDTILELDEIDQIHIDAFEKLKKYGFEQSYLPEYIEDIDLYVYEMQVIADIANCATFEYLDTNTPLYADTIQAIINGRPYFNQDFLANLARLADRPNVGSASISHLKSHIASWPGCEEAETAQSCLVDEDCGENSYCHGTPYDGSTEEGYCRKSQTIEGYWDDCSFLDACNPGLICVGYWAYDGFGWCGDNWLAQTRTNNDSVAIPETGAVSSIVIKGLATVPMDGWLYLELDHSDPSCLVIELENPDGSKDVVWDGPNENSEFPKAFNTIPRGDESVNGRWTLHISNPGECGSGSLNSWQFYVTSRFD
jgi:hypothetical protein